MVVMFDDDALTIDCDTCVATGTTACNDCVVGHLLANEDGPIELVVAPPRRATIADRAAGAAEAADRAVELFAAAGLLDDPPVFVAPFAAADRAPAPGAARPAFGPGRRHPSRGRGSTRSR
jgi:hypothetical protein